MIDYPWPCTHCGRLNMVDLLMPERREAGKLVSEDGFVCECGVWNVMFYTTISLREAMRKLESMDVRRRDFRYHFAKVLKKAEGIQAKNAPL